MTAAAGGSTARACSKALASLPLSSRLRVRQKRYLCHINLVMDTHKRAGKSGEPHGAGAPPLCLSVGGGVWGSVLDGLQKVSEARTALGDGLSVQTFCDICRDPSRVDTLAKQVFEMKLWGSRCHQVATDQRFPVPVRDRL